MDLKAARAGLHSMASELRGVSGKLGQSNVDPVPPDCGDLSPKVGDILAGFNSVMGNMVEMLDRSAADVDASAETYNGTEDDNVQRLDNLKTELPPANNGAPPQPPPQAQGGK